MSTLPGWVGPTIAIALVVIALGFVAIVGALLLAGRRVAAEAASLSREVADLRRELGPTIQAVNQLAGTSADVGGRLKSELESLLSLSERLRHGVARGAKRVEGRLEDLDALYEVVSTEVEDTALDVAAKLRAFRTGTSALARIRRLVTRSRR